MSAYYIIYIINFFILIYYIPVILNFFIAYNLYYNLKNKKSLF